MDNLQTARNFFEQCDYGKGWDACKAYCQQDATFETEAETLSAINTLDTYCDWMTDAIDMFDDNVEIEIKGLSNAKQIPFAVDTPIRRPVKEPGPLLIAMASKLFLEIPEISIASMINK